MRRTFTIRLPFRRLILDAPSLDDIVPPHRALHHIKDAVHEQITLGRQLVSWYRREKVWWSLRDDRGLLQRVSWSSARPRPLSSSSSTTTSTATARRRICLRRLVSPSCSSKI